MQKSKCKNRKEGNETIVKEIVSLHYKNERMKERKKERKKERT